MAFQDRLKERREFLKMSRAELAEKLNVTISAIGNYENGISSPKTEILFDIFKVLDCDANYLFQDEISNKNTITPEATEVAQAYDKVEFEKQNIVRLTLGLELKKQSKVIEIHKEKELPEHLKINAARAIPGASEEDKRHDDDIMDDENF